MTCKEKSQVPQESQQTPSEPSQETPLKESEEAREVTAEIKSESPGCDGPDSHKWDNKMEVQRILSGKPDLEIKGTPEATGSIEQPKPPAKKKNS
ncbi:MAG TPA: hypothetical protein VMW72_24125 [Sedimentisphaerales bacterium]|nr:hypothetical protein [Sedimentisphaerales bacterium]